MTRGLTIGCLFLAAALAITPSARAQSPSHDEVRYLLERWEQTPQQRGLLTTAIIEAATALQHARLALAEPEDRDAIVEHMDHALHALDPTKIAAGPGLDFGVISATDGSIQHIGLAANYKGRTDNILRHAEHVWTSLHNAARRARKALTFIGPARQAESAEKAYAIAQEFHDHLEAVVYGEDENASGSITWQEGGLLIARQHMVLLYEGEGMALTLPELPEHLPPPSADSAAAE